MELTCYLYPGWQPRLRPASPRRDWMDATPESFAYRCLPLNIANAHGWELLSPCGFDAVWDGGSGVEAVRITIDEGAPPEHRPVSLFGQGVLTFHVAGLFRTPPGWNLWVGGPPNDGKDGIAPLNGIIETDWSPYSFTMNWRFTRSGHSIRFEENEPVCQLFPIERAAIEAMTPRFLPIDDNPELKRQFAAWSRSRDAFHKEMAENPPNSPGAKWQKLYYRGVDADGAEAVDDHQSKLRVRPFGNAPAPPPVRAPAAKRCPAAPPLETPAPSADALTLAKREWLLRTQERMRGLSVAASGVFRKEGIGHEEFLDEHYAPGRPVLLGGAMKSWAALGRWSPAYLRDTVGARPVEVQVDREADPAYERLKDAHKATIAFDAFIDRVTAPGAGNGTYLTAYNSAANASALKVLRKDIGEVVALLRPGSAAAEGMPWIGPAGTVTPLHHDLTNNLVLQVTGRKRVVLASPAESGRIYNDQHVFSAMGDVLSPDFDAAAFPLAADARWHSILLGPGDALFIPIGWWHQVTALDFSVTITCTSFLWPNDGYATYPER